MYLQIFFIIFKQKTAYEIRISDWSSDVCSSNLSYRERLDKPNRPERAPAAPRPQLPDRLIAILDNDEIRFTDENDVPLDPALYPPARRAMKEEIAGLLERNAAARNAEADQIGRAHV